jgi:VanZ family protein
LTKIKPSFAPAIIWFIISTILLTLPGSDIPKAGWLDKIYFDKIVHVGMFALLSVLWCFALLKKTSDRKKLRQWFLSVAIIWIIYGIAMEFVQRYFIPGRSFDINDMIADAAGATAGLIFSTRYFIKK